MQHSQPPRQLRALMFSPRRSACPWDSVIASKSPSDPRQRLTINETRAKCVPWYGVICAFLNRRNRYVEWPPTESPIYLSSPPLLHSSSKKKERKKKGRRFVNRRSEWGTTMSRFLRSMAAFIRAGITGRLAMGSSTLQMRFNQCQIRILREKNAILIRIFDFLEDTFRFLTKSLSYILWKIQNSLSLL